MKIAMSIIVYLVCQESICDCKSMNSELRLISDYLFIFLCLRSR